MASDAFISANLRARSDKASEILSAPNGSYKVCGVCNGIVAEKSAICPACHSYQFDYNREALISSCEKLSLTAFPTSSGTIPRNAVIPPVDKVMPEPQIV